VAIDTAEAKPVTETASAATDISDQNARFVRRRYNAKAVGAVAITPNAKMNSSASPNACMPEDASRSGPARENNMYRDSDEREHESGNVSTDDGTYLR
jgi:hypothetical protein